MKQEQSFPSLRGTFSYRTVQRLLMTMFLLVITPILWFLGAAFGVLEVSETLWQCMKSIWQ